MTTIELWAPAKLTVTLAVTGVRDDEREECSSRFDQKRCQIDGPNPEADVGGMLNGLEHGQCLVSQVKCDRSTGSRGWGVVPMLGLRAHPHGVSQASRT